MSVKQAKSSERPFFEKKYPCPVCKKESVHYYLRDRTYVIDQRDDDYFISKYTWRDPQHKLYNLYAFHIWHCPYCKYTDERGYFYQKELKESRVHFHLLKRLILEKAASDPVVQIICEDLEYPTVEMLSVLNLHLLSVYIHLMLNEEHLEYEKIARLYLRTAWLFRILSHKTEYHGMDQFLTEYFNLYDHLQKNIMNSLSALEDMNMLISREAENSNSRIWDFFLGKYKNMFRENYQNSLEATDQLIRQLAHYHALGEQIKSDYLTSTQSLLTMPYQGYTRYIDLLKAIHMYWTDVPIHEEDAIRKAEKYFRKALATSAFNDDKFKRFNVYKLIIILNEKLRLYTRALDYCSIWDEELSNLKRVAENRLERITTEEDTTFDPIHLRNIARRSEEMGVQLEKIRSRIIARQMEKDEHTAQFLFDKHREATVEEFQNILEEANLDETIVQKYTLLKKHEKRRGLFQLFRSAPF